MYFSIHRTVYTHIRTPLNSLVKQALLEASEKHPYDRVIVGDSVAHQLFNQDNQKKSKYFHLTTNAATTMMGQYILLMEYMKHNKVEEIIVLMTPYSMTDDLNREFTANYVVGTMYRPQYRQYITERAAHQIHNCRWWYIPIVFSEFPELCLINYQKVNPKPFPRELFISPLSLEYLTLLSNVCQHHGVTLRVISPPIPVEFEGSSDLSFIEQQLSSSGLDGIRKTYCPVSVMPSEYYADELHPKKQYVELFRNALNINWERAEY
ncbi:MAG: hypothetical protein PHP44_07900 [Kiritimatiellae bacterium]|nr:hypothetical protein [Kiritimatiellia bacterium]